MDILFIIMLVLLNGVFAMAEIAILSSRKNRLQQMAARGQRGAQTALELISKPSNFLSSVQVGITLISILLGALGEPSLSRTILPFVQTIPYLASYASQITFLIVITSITFFTIIVGELVPKRIAVSHPEGLAIVMAPVMKAVATVTQPFVTVLSGTTETIFRLLRLKPTDELSVTEEEVRMMIREGTRVGVFNKTERDLVERALRMDDVKVNSLMKPRNEIEAVDAAKFKKSPREFMKDYNYEYLIMINQTIDSVTGVIYLKDFLKEYADTRKFNIRKHSQKPLLVPESMRILKVLELFRNSAMHVALVVDEYGNIQGLVTFNDILRALVGEIVSKDKSDDPEIVRRKDGSYLLDGMISITDLKKTLKVEQLPKEENGTYQTLGGFILSHLEKVPKSGDRFQWDGLQFEIVDMDQHRVDKVIVTKMKKK